MRNVIIFAIMFTMVVASSSFAGVWKETFTGGTDNPWNEISGVWEAKDGVYERTDKKPEYAKSTSGSDDWTDYTVEADITIVGGAQGSVNCAAGILMRTDENGAAGYRFWIRDDGSGFQFSVWVENTFIHVITNAAERAVADQVYHLTVQIEGFSISAWVDDRIMVEDYDEADQFFASGRIGLISYDSYARYDNVQVSGPDIIAVNSAGKLAAKWGHIKTELR